jgi:hypothetical protein
MPICVINQMKDKNLERLSASLKKIKRVRPLSQVPKSVSTSESDQCNLAFSACGFASQQRSKFEEQENEILKQKANKKKITLPSLSKERSSIVSPNHNGLWSLVKRGSKIQTITKHFSGWSPNNNRESTIVENNMLSLSPNHNSPNNIQNNNNNSNRNLLEAEPSCWDGVYLHENYSEQGDTILKHLEEQNKIKRNKELEKKIYNRWIRALPREEREEKYFAELEKEVGCFTRYLPMSELKKDIERVYGVGEKRRLRPGEESAIIDTIIKMIAECLTIPELLLHSVTGLNIFIFVENY